MTTGKAYITFLLDGQSYEYDGGLPTEIVDRFAYLLDLQGFWIGGYPRDLAATGADELDELPTARWEIEHIGGQVQQVHGARENGAIHLDDWKKPRIH